MALIIGDNSDFYRSDRVFFRDLQAICAEDSLGLECVELPTDLNGNAYYKVIYTRNLPASYTSGFPGVEMIDYFVNNYSGTVTIWGLPSDTICNTHVNLPTCFVGSKISDKGGLTENFPNGNSVICYDVDLCNGNGYHANDINGNAIPFPPHVILFHELAHARVRNGSNAEDEAITLENHYRVSKGLPTRNGHGGGCNLEGGQNFWKDAFAGCLPCILLGMGTVLGMIKLIC